MPYVLSRLIYNVSGKGETRVGAREEAQRHELGAHLPAPLTDGETEARRGEVTEACDSRLPGPAGTSDASALFLRRGDQVSGPPAPAPGVVLMDYCFSF